MESVLVTGATGYVGRNLLGKARLAFPAGAWVGLTRSAAKGALLGIDDVRFVEGDVAEPDTMRAAFDGIDTVIHLAAAINPRTRAEFHRTNVVGTMNVVALARAAGVRRLLFLSSCDVRDGVGLYAATKRQAEEYVERSGLAYCILRPTVIYGGVGTTPMTILEAVAKRTPVVPVIGSGRQLLQPLHVEDLIGVIGQAISGRRERGVYEMGGPERFTHVQLVHAIRRFLGKRGPSIALPVPLSLVRVLLTPFMASAYGKSAWERMQALSGDKVASNDDLTGVFDVSFTAFADGLLRTDRTVRPVT